MTAEYMELNVELGSNRFPTGFQITAEYMELDLELGANRVPPGFQITAENMELDLGLGSNRVPTVYGIRFATGFQQGSNRMRIHSRVYQNRSHHLRARALEQTFLPGMRPKT